MKENGTVNKICGGVDEFQMKLGHFLSWVNAALIAVIVTQVTLRYGFGRGYVMLEELEWHLYSVAFMFGLSYALVTDAHVRVDLLRGRFSRKTVYWIEVLGTVFLLFPFIIAVLVHSWDFFYDSWTHSERSAAPLGLPWRWAIKAVIPISFVVLGLAALTHVARCVAGILGKDNGSH